MSRRASEWAGEKVARNGDQTDDLLTEGGARLGAEKSQPRYSLQGVAIGRDILWADSWKDCREPTVYHWSVALAVIWISVRFCSRLALNGLLSLLCYVAQ